MGDNARGGNSVDDPPTYALRLWKIETGTNYTMRMVSREYRGCFAHYLRSGSRWCPGEDRGCKNHRLEKVWKGYAGVIVWDSATRYWYPTVLEITERMELDFRDRYARAQEWIVSRPPEKKGKASPLTARFIGQVEAELVPPEFDIMPVVRYIYHSGDVELVETNPTPSRVVLSASAGQAPLGTPTDKPKPASADDARKFSELLKLNGWKKAEQAESAK